MVLIVSYSQTTTQRLGRQLANPVLDGLLDWLHRSLDWKRTGFMVAWQVNRPQFNRCLHAE